MFHDVAVKIGIQLTLMLLVNGWEASVSAKDDMVNKIGITHDGTKVHKMPQLHKTCRAVGSPPATFTWTSTPVVMLTLSLRSVASITTGYSDGRPPGVCIAAYDYYTRASQRGAQWASASPIPDSTRVTQRAAQWAAASPPMTTTHGLLRGAPNGRLHRRL